MATPEAAEDRPDEIVRSDTEAARAAGQRNDRSRKRQSNTPPATTPRTGPPRERILAAEAESLARHNIDERNEVSARWQRIPARFQLCLRHCPGDRDRIGLDLIMLIFASITVRSTRRSSMPRHSRFHLRSSAFDAYNERSDGGDHYAQPPSDTVQEAANHHDQAGAADGRRPQLSAHSDNPSMRRIGCTGLIVMIRSF